MTITSTPIATQTSALQPNTNLFPSYNRIDSSQLQGDWKTDQNAVIPPLNQFLQATQQALQGGVTFGSNITSDQKQFQITTPSSDLTPITTALQAGWTAYPNIQCNDGALHAVAYRIDAAGNAWLTVNYLSTPASLGGGGQIVYYPGGLPTAIWPNTSAYLAAVLQYATSAYQPLTVYVGVNGALYASNPGVTVAGTFAGTFVWPTAGYTPGVYSCFPLFWNTTLTVQPSRVYVDQCIDVTTSGGYFAVATGNPAWTYGITNGQPGITIKNVPGLSLKRSYNLTMTAIP